MPLEAKVWVRERLPNKYKTPTKTLQTSLIIRFKESCNANFKDSTPNSKNKVSVIIQVMTDKEKIITCIATIDSMLSLDFMTNPVRADLNTIKTHLVAVRDNLD